MELNESQCAINDVAIQRCLIVEDHPHAQTWLSGALRLAFPDVSVVVVSSISEAHDCLDSLCDKGLYPDLALVDLNLPDGDGIDIIKRLALESSRCFSVVATIYDDDEHIFPALRAGAKGYILKEQEQLQIVQMLKALRRGEPPLSPAISNRLIHYFSDSQSKFALKDQLSKRELLVLKAVAQGGTLSDVAKSLDVKRNTVASQLKSIYGKLRISSRAEATAMAIKMGLLDVE